jgi:hypothetical protein
MIPPAWPKKAPVKPRNAANLSARGTIFVRIAAVLALRRRRRRRGMRCKGFAIRMIMGVITPLIDYYLIWTVMGVLYTVMVLYKIENRCYTYNRNRG